MENPPNYQTANSGGMQMTVAEALTIIFCHAAEEAGHPNGMTPAQRKHVGAVRLIEQIYRQELSNREFFESYELSQSGTWRKTRPEIALSIETVQKNGFIAEIEPYNYDGPTDAEISATPPEVQRFYALAKLHEWTRAEWQSLLRTYGIKSETPFDIDLKETQKFYFLLKDEYQHEVIKHGLRIEKQILSRNKAA